MRSEKECVLETIKSFQAGCDVEIEVTGEVLAEEPWQCWWILGELVSNAIEQLRDEEDGHIWISFNDNGYMVEDSRVYENIEEIRANIERSTKEGRAYTTKEDNDMEEALMNLRGKGILIARKMLQELGGKLEYEIVEGRVIAQVSLG